MHDILPTLLAGNINSPYWKPCIIANGSFENLGLDRVSIPLQARFVG